ncbi:MAG: hypothetical protein NVS9B4_00200 [Candidatus Acidiferrum sp.]
MATLQIPRAMESHHIQIAGDTGSGKSTLIREILYQIEARGETAVVFDPHREYISESYNSARGDYNLNPIDARCPYYALEEEVDNEAQAMAPAHAFFPGGPTQQEFFMVHTRAIYAYLAGNYKPTAREMGRWMANPQEIDLRVKGTEHEHTLTENAAPQRAGILGTLNMAGRPLRMLPDASGGRRKFSVREWARKRRSWIFVTSTPDTLDAVRPLQSFWLDMIILALQSQNADVDAKRCWLVLDEVQELQKLPQLPRALTGQRKSGNPIVIGFQGMAQIDASYGKQSETMLSQAGTNIVLRTREPRAAEHLSNLIGKVEIERLRETRSKGLFRRQQGSESMERVVQPLVMASEIQGLDDMNGYFVQGNRVVKMKFGRRPVRKVAAGFIERRETKNAGTADNFNFRDVSECATVAGSAQS